MEAAHERQGLAKKIGQAELVDPGLTQDLGTTGSMSKSSLSRRALLVRMTASTAAAAMGVGVPRLFAKQETKSPSIDRIAGETQVSRAVAGGARRAQAFRIRLKAAHSEFKVPLPLQISNGDENLYPNRIGSYSKGLPHDSIGEVDPPAYSSLLTAVGSMDPNDFANIPLGGNVKLADPQGGLAFDLEGTDSGQLTIPPSPALASAERAGEMVEDYWMALTRDVPFSQYGSEAVTAAAIADLNKLADFKGPRVDGQVTAATLFRGFTTADLVGPFLSQFLLLPVSFGTLSVLQQYKTYASGTDYLTDFASCLACQNGQDPFPPNVVSGTSYTKSGRDLGAYVHADLPYQAYLTAAQWLLADKVPLNPGNPYLHVSNQSGFQTFGGPHILDLLGEVTNRALKAVWYQKWFVHRTVRPEAYGCLVHQAVSGVAKYPVHSDVLNSQAIDQVFSRYGSYLLPSAYPEGCPQHPSYAEGHGAIAGACVTVLKAFFNENSVIPNPVVASDDGQFLLPYTAPDAGEITVGGELNKLASNIALGRDMAGVHWRSDAVQSILLGEAVAVSILRDQRSTFNEPFSGLTFTKFDGTTVTV